MDKQSMVACLGDRAADFHALSVSVRDHAEIRFLKGTGNSVMLPALDEVMDRNLRELRNTADEASDADFAMELVRTLTGPDRLPPRPLDTKPKPYKCPLPEELTPEIPEAETT